MKINSLPIMVFIMNASRAVFKLEYAPLLYCKSSVYICATLFMYITFLLWEYGISRFRFRRVRIAVTSNNPRSINRRLCPLFSRDYGTSLTTAGQNKFRLTGLTLWIGMMAPIMVEREVPHIGLTSY